MDEREEEREFLEGLKARTGRDLASWMAAIAAQGFNDKNEIIDWLRGQGLPFARASWLERIHRNGGKPIHAAGPAAPVAPAPAGADPAGLTPAHPRPIAPSATPVPPPRLVPLSPTSPPRPPAAAPALLPTPVTPPMQTASTHAPKAGGPPKGAAIGSEPQGVTPAQSTAKVAKKVNAAPPLVEPTADATALAKLVATAKGYRPLYNFLEAQLRKTIPGVVIAARDRYIAIGAPREFAAVTLHPTEVRLGLNLGDRPFDALLQQAKLRGPGPAISHMVVLTDARQVGSELLGLARTACERVNAKP